MKLRIALLAVVLFAMSAIAQAQTYKAGDKVMVKSWDVTLGESGKEVKTHVELGDIFTISKINGDWLWVGRGWIDKSDVVPVDQAIAYFTAQIRREPSDSRNYGNRAEAYRKMDELDKAISDITEVIRLDANKPIAADFIGRGNMWHRKGEQDIAIADYNEAIRLDPKSVFAYNNRGEAWCDKEEFDQAIKDYGTAIRLDPKHAYAYDNRAWIWATCRDEKFRDGKKAVESATKACELDDWRSADELDTLAAAYAEKGDFDSAIKWENKAIEMGLESESDKKPEDLRARLELYKSGKPYRDERRGK